MTDTISKVETRVPVADPDATVQPREEAPPATPGGNPRARRTLLRVLAVVVVVALVIWAVLHFFFSPPQEDTDDAYVAGDVVAVTARDPGQVIAIHADNTDAVSAGQPLIELDPTTADVNLASAAADLARAVRSTRASFSQVGTAGATVAQAQAQLQQAQSDVARRQSAAREGAVSGEELSHAQDMVRVATANLAAARAGQAQAQSAVAGTDLNTNPAVMAAIAAYRRAAIMRSHMHIVAPTDGQVAQRTVQIGQQIAAGTPLMAVVPLRRVWIDANFRETQLRDLRIGQPVTVTVDAYGSDTVFHGRVQGVGAGSGNAFALLPPQNASGNWIKIVQRVPVRIALNPNELDRTPLRIGLSVKVTVDTHNTGGAILGRPTRMAAASEQGETPIDPAVDQRIRQIIAANR